MRPFTWTKVAGVLAVLGFAGTAGAAERFNQSGTFALGAERLFGVSWDKQTFSNGGTSVSDSATSVSLLGKQLSSDPFAGPRIAFDYFVTDAISLGGSVGYSSISVSNDLKSSAAGVTVTGSDTTLHGWIVSPRVGYGYAFNDTVGLWPRLGFTYVGQSTSSPDTKAHYFALSAEVPLVITPVPHAMLIIAPTVDWGFSGSEGVVVNGNTATVDSTAIALGLHAGLGVWF